VAGRNWTYQGWELDALKSMLHLLQGKQLWIWARHTWRLQTKQNNLIHIYAPDTVQDMTSRFSISTLVRSVYANRENQLPTLTRKRNHSGTEYCNWKEEESMLIKRV
jgi:hypothetical protein